MKTTEREEIIYGEYKQFEQVADVKKILAKRYNLTLHQIGRILLEGRRGEVKATPEELEKFEQYSRRFFLLCKKRGWTEAQAQEAFGKFGLRWEDIVIANRG